MKTLIVYYSFTHNNEVLARKLQHQLNCDIVKLEELNRRTAFTFFREMLFKHKPTIGYPPTSLQHYDHLLFVAPIWAGKIASPMRTFLLSSRAQIKHYSFISVCGGREQQRERIQQELTALLWRAPKKISELWVSHLHPKGKAIAPPLVSSYRITEEDIATFQPVIDAHLEELQLTVLDEE